MTNISYGKIEGSTFHLQHSESNINKVYVTIHATEGTNYAAKTASADLMVKDW